MMAIVSNKYLKSAIVAAIAVLSAIIIFSSVDKTPVALDIDEPAWIFDSYYWDLYTAGDWKSDNWRAFDKYASHPPAAKYAFGIAMHAIGQPVKSIEPRKFWFENDLDIVNYWDSFYRNMSRRVSYEQIMGGRYMAAFFAWLAALATLLLGYRLIGLAGGLAGFLFLLYHPLFKDIATLSTGDSFFVMFTVLSVIVATELGRAVARADAKKWLFALALAVILGILFATKIAAFASVGALALAVAIFAKDRRSFVMSCAIFTFSVLLAFGVTYLLDPGIHGSPIQSIIDRIAMRRERIEIQQIVFVGQKLATVGERIVFAAYNLFYSSVFKPVILAFCIAGAVSIAFHKRSSERFRDKILIVALAVYFSALTIYCLPMAWTRYIAAYLPFIMILAGLGFAFLLEIAMKRRELTKKVRLFFLSAAASVLLISTVLQHIISPVEAHMPPVPSASEFQIGGIYAYSLMHPGGNREIHQYLEKYFEDKGDMKKAEYQRNQLDSMVQ